MINRKNKYKNIKVVYEDICFDSKKEMLRYVVLKQAQQEGLICNLELQPKFVLIPTIKETYVKHLKTKDREYQRTIQLPITYTADFSYIKDGEKVIEDVKASKFLLPKEFVLKVKMMRYFHGLKVKCIYKANDPV